MREIDRAKAEEWRIELLIGCEHDHFNRQGVVECLGSRFVCTKSDKYPVKRGKNVVMMVIFNFIKTTLPTCELVASTVLSTQKDGRAPTMTAVVRSYYMLFLFPERRHDRVEPANACSQGLLHFMGCFISLLSLVQSLTMFTSINERPHQTHVIFSVDT